MKNKQTRKEIIERTGLLLEKYCDSCIVKKTITKEHGNNEALKYCLEICKHGKEIADLGIKLQLPLEKGGSVILSKENLNAALLQGLTWAQIEVLFNYSRRNLQERAEKWEIHYPKKRKQPADSLQKYLKYRREGKSQEQIAVLLNITGKTLQKWRRGWGVE